jgi:putative membrane protein
MQHLKLFRPIVVLAMVTFVLPAQNRIMHRANRASTDSTFAEEAAQGGMAEVQMAQLALSKTNNQAVKDLADKILRDHTQANEELTQITAKNNVILPVSMDAKDQAESDKLKALSGAAFDREYVTYEIQDHKNNLRKFDHESMHGMDPAVKQWTAKYVPVLQTHLSVAENALKAVK